MKNKQERIKIIKNESADPIRNKLLIGTPTLGIVRVEWCSARYGQVIPCNWSMAGIWAGYSHTFPIGYRVADAQNILVHEALKSNYEWLLFLEDDVILPIDAFLKINRHMQNKEVPVVSGLYFLKSEPPEPLVYRGRGNGAFLDFKMGDLIECDGVPTGCLLINCKLLKVISDDSENYVTGTGQTVKKVFETPAKVWSDPEAGTYQTASGTSDLYWCDRIITGGYLKKAGFTKASKSKYPYIVDTNIFCKHIDLSSGKQYPINLIWNKKIFDEL